MSQRGFSTIALIIAITVILGAGVYFAVIKNLTITQPTPTSPQDETADWKIYRDEDVYGKYDFELKYPKDWQYVAHRFSVHRWQVAFSPKTPSWMSDEERGRLSERWPILRIDRTVNIDGADARTLFEKSILPDLRKDIDRGVRDIKIGGVNAIQYTDLGMFDTQNYIVATNNLVINISFSGGDIEEIVGPLQNTVDKILSTFKFIKLSYTILGNDPLINEYGLSPYNVFQKHPEILASLKALDSKFTDYDMDVSDGTKVIIFNDGRKMLLLEGCFPHACAGSNKMALYDLHSKKMYLAIPSGILGDPDSLIKEFLLENYRP